MGRNGKENGAKGKAKNFSNGKQIEIHRMGMKMGILVACSGRSKETAKASM